MVDKQEALRRSQSVNEHRLGVAQAIAGLLDRDDFLTGAVFSTITGIRRDVDSAQHLSWKLLWADIKNLEKTGPDFRRNVACLLLSMSWSGHSGLEFKSLEMYSKIARQQFPELGDLLADFKDRDKLINYLAQLQTHDSDVFSPELVHKTLTSL